MKVIETKLYKCEICGKTYSSPSAAELCESQPISGDKGAEIGDIVVIIAGEGIGEKAKVTAKGVHDMYWGWRHYWHTVWVNADLIDGWSTRTLSFDQYELVEE